MSHTILFFCTAPVESFSSETKNVNKEVFHRASKQGKRVSLGKAYKLHRMMNLPTGSKITFTQHYSQFPKGV